MRNHSYFFLSGMVRSGTSLLNRLLNSLPDVQCQSQEQTALFLGVKNEFLKQRYTFTYHILNNYFPATFTPDEVTCFLDYEKFYVSYFEAVSKNPKEPRSILLGDKEVLCEEFLPHLLKSGCKCILIIRNPKDVIASMHFGKGQQFTGIHRPLLFDLRNWRKSIAYAIHLSRTPGFLMIRYEDLIAYPLKEMERIATFLEIRLPTKFDLSNIYRENGEIWLGNSSYYEYLSGISPASMGAGVKLFSPNIISFVEAVTFPEMKWSGYPTNSENHHNIDIIRAFKDPHLIERQEFINFNYQEELQREIDRIKTLTGTGKEDHEKLFIFPEVYKILKELDAGIETF